MAELCVQSLRLASAAFDRRAIDVVAKDVGDGVPTTDFVALLEKMDKNCSYKDMEDRIKIATHQLAKKQRSRFRRYIAE